MMDQAAPVQPPDPDQTKPLSVETSRPQQVILNQKKLQLPRLSPNHFHQPNLYTIFPSSELKKYYHRDRDHNHHHDNPLETVANIVPKAPTDKIRYPNPEVIKQLPLMERCMTGISKFIRQNWFAIRTFLIIGFIIVIILLLPAVIF